MTDHLYDQYLQYEQTQSLPDQFINDTKNDEDTMYPLRHNPTYCPYPPPHPPHPPQVQTHSSVGVLQRQETKANPQRKQAQRYYVLEMKDSNPLSQQQLDALSQYGYISTYFSTDDSTSTPFYYNQPSTPSTTPISMTPASPFCASSLPMSMGMNRAEPMIYNYNDYAHNVNINVDNSNAAVLDAQCSDVAGYVIPNSCNPFVSDINVCFV